MKKLMLILPVMLAACQKPIFFLYEGNKTIVGEGGFVEHYIPASSINNSIINKKTEYKYDGVWFYKSGLPTGETCILIGYVADSLTRDVARNALKLGANTATKSTVSFPVKFTNNTGFMDGVGSADDWYNGYGQKSAVGYNIFECKQSKIKK
jgi:hypothetical protein